MKRGSIQVSGTVEHKGVRYGYTANVTLGRPGKTYGPPERCYPDEPAEIDIVECNVVDEDDDIVTGIANPAPSIEALINEHAEEQAGDEATEMQADDDDRKYDEMRDNARERD